MITARVGEKNKTLNSGVEKGGYCNNPSDKNYKGELIGLNDRFSIED